MKFTLYIALLIIFFNKASAQFYYFDIFATNQTNQVYTQLKGLGIKKITGTSFEGREPSKDFVLEQTIAADGSSITTRSATIGSAESFFTGFYSNNKVVNTIDSGNNAINSIAYEYDNAGRVTAINLISKDFDGEFAITELHQWSYNTKGLPEKMLKIKNTIDTTVVTFLLDDIDNIIEERWTKKGSRVETYFYYYNELKQLTDIVRYNRKAKAMLPDFMFEYDENGNLSQMTQPQSGSANYLTWRYAYNPNGLKAREVAFNKQKELVGRIEYSYQ